MKVSMDGLRMNLGKAFNEVVESFREDDHEALIDALWKLRQMIGALMCIYSDDPEDLFSNMTEESEKLSAPTEIIKEEAPHA